MAQFQQELFAISSSRHALWFFYCNSKIFYTTVTWNIFFTLLTDRFILSWSIWKISHKHCKKLVSLHRERGRIFAGRKSRSDCVLVGLDGSVEISTCGGWSSEPAGWNQLRLSIRGARLSIRSSHFRCNRPSQGSPSRVPSAATAGTLWFWLRN